MRKLLLSALAWLCLAAPCAAAIGTPVQVGAGHGYGVTSLNISVTGVNAGQFLAVAISSDSGWSSLTCGDNQGSAGWVRLGPFTGPGSGKNWLCYCPSPSAGVTTVTLGGGVAGSKIAGAVIQVSGVATASPLDATGPGSSGSGTSATSVPITTTNANDLLVGVLAFDAQSTSPAATGFTFLAGDPGALGNHGVYEAYRIVSSATNYSFAPSWTTSNFYGVNVYAFKAAAGGGAPLVCTLLLTGYGSC